MEVARSLEEVNGPFLTRGTRVAGILISIFFFNDYH